MTTSTIRPGILIALRTQVSGGVEYQRNDLAPDDVVTPAANDSATKVEAWKTIKITADAAEHAKAVSVAGLARREVTKLCMATSFGLLAAEALEKELDEAHARARTMVVEFNATARYTRIGFAMLKGRIAASDEEAVRAITNEIGALVAGMNTAIDNLDVDAIRAAAGKAASLAAILGDEEQKTVTAAVEAARKAARMIVKRVATGGEPAAVVLADMQRGAIERARVAFADMDERPENETSGEQMPAGDMGRVAGLDLDSGRETPAAQNQPPVAATPAAEVAIGIDFGDASAIQAPRMPASLPTIDWD